MKPPLLSSLCVIAAMTLAAAGCGKKETPVDATRPLQESFQAAEPPVKEAIESVNVHLRARDYTAAARALAPVVMEKRLSESERHAVGLALEQINQGIAADRSLDTKEMYELRLKMFRAVHHGGPRF